MEIITKYKASDGREFLSESLCLIHESRVKEVEAIAKWLPARPDKFINPDVDFLQHDWVEFEAHRKALLEWAIMVNPTNKEIFEKLISQKHPYWAHRFLDDQDYFHIDVFRHASYRIHCTDSLYREWEQPYFTIQAEKALEELKSK